MHLFKAASVAKSASINVENEKKKKKNAVSYIAKIQISFHM